MPAIAQILVSPSAAAMAAYADAVGFGLDISAEPRVFTQFFALSWLSHPAIRQLIVDACPAGSLPMQIKQTIEMGDVISAGGIYTVTATLESGARQVQLNYAIIDSFSTVCTRGEVVFIWIAEADISRVLS